VFREAGAKVLLAAPTGRAAKRISETSGLEAKTIHRLLEYSPAEDGFNRNENNPLACSLLIIDEASMMDTMLMYHLIKAAPLGTTLILVGDVNQLPSVGPGNVLKDVITSGVVPVVELYEVFRQAAESDIICNAHLINSGHLPELHQKKNEKTDFYFFRQDDPEAAADLVVDLVCRKIPETFGFKPEDIQVLSPMLRGAVGVNSLNSRLQQAINRQDAQLVRGDRIFRLHDRVMQTRNNYDKDVFNGDMGDIIYLNAEDREITVRFDERNVNYLWEDMDELIPSYAISIHKSQGGEYPVVVVPLMMQHYMLLQRNLVYTAVTRGKKLVVLVGEWRALAMAVKNNHIRQRYTWLAHRLAGESGSLSAGESAGLEPSVKTQ
ncbi:MAG: AAA family ATPase, partial [Mailhella sp.]|nr:AAA family ATPase [Mailhella sp.]